MTAVTYGTTTTWKGGISANPFTRSIAKVLAGVLIPRGSLVMANDDRAMPAGPIDVTKTAAQGGPLKVAGGTADGDLFYYSLAPYVRVTVANGAALAVAIDGNDITITIVSGTTTALQVFRAILAHGVVSQVLGVIYGGNGSGTAGVQTQIRVPYIRLLGMADFEIDNTANNTDQAILLNKSEFRAGRVWLLNDTNYPVDAKCAPGKVSILDNVTGTILRLPTLLTADLDDIGQAGEVAGMLCIRIP